MLSSIHSLQIGVVCHVFDFTRGLSHVVAPLIIRNQRCGSICLRYACFVQPVEARKSARRVRCSAAAFRQ
jgi:hypothetical protein